ncbi:MAG: hypothetical protein QOC77_76 [Thermoleophilaceae bacterium]|jgi:hypothetical protein|nr:hypothetical protein [Thermoleophilaceae bacterium]
MDPIRPIGPVERDLEPVLRVTRTSRDGQRERRQQPEEQQSRTPQEAAPDSVPPPAAPGTDPDGPSLIDIKV